MILVQARSTSQRFPGKHLAPLCGSTVMDTLISRASQAMPLAYIIPTGDPLRSELERRKVDCFEGPEHDVLKRHVLAMDFFELSWCIRVTGDCPLISPQDILWMANACVGHSIDFGTNCRRAGTDGQEIEFISRRLMRHMQKVSEAGAQHEWAMDEGDREHVTTWVKRNWDHLKAQFRFYEGPIQYGWQMAGKISIDTPEDLERVDLLMRAVKFQEAGDE